MDFATIICCELALRWIHVLSHPQTQHMTMFTQSLCHVSNVFINLRMSLFFFLWRCGPTRAMASSFLRFLDHTQRHITVGRTPLDTWSVRRRDLPLTTHNTRNRQKSMPPVGFEPMIAAGERPQTYALDRAATGTGKNNAYANKMSKYHIWRSYC